MSDQAENRREVTVTRDASGILRATNSDGVQITMSGIDPASFSPIELLLAAIAGCSALDVDALTSRRSEPDEFVARVSAYKNKDATGGNLLTDIKVEFTVTFPEGAAGDAARERLQPALDQSHSRLCTVSRTVEAGTPVSIVLSA